MKVALVILRGDARRGGAERYVADLAAALAGRGIEAAVLCGDGAETGAGHVPLGLRGVTRLAKYRNFLDAVDNHLAGHSYDLVHAMLPVRRCDLYHPHAGLAVAQRDRGAGARAAIGKLAHRLNRKRAAFAKVERTLVDNPAGPVVLCLSKYVQASVRAAYCLSSASVSEWM